jgi:hypothetical protein
MMRLFRIVLTETILNVRKKTAMKALHLRATRRRGVVRDLLMVTPIPFIAALGAAESVASNRAIP